MNHDALHTQTEYSLLFTKVRISLANRFEKTLYRMDS